MVPVRAEHEPAHLAYLQANRDEIVMAGGLRSAHGGPYVGGLWVFEVSSWERAVALIEQDPYHQANPRQYRLLVWGKALPQYQVLV